MDTLSNTEFPFYLVITPNNTSSGPSPSSEALSTTQSQYTLAGLHHASHDDASTNTVTEAPMHEAREEQEGGLDNETDDEVEELIEGRDLVGRAEAAGVQSWPEIRKRLDDILAKEGVKWAMPYHQVRLESCPMSTVLIDIKVVSVSVSLRVLKSAFKGEKNNRGKHING